MFYGWISESFTEKLQFSFAAETAVGRDSAASFSFVVLNDLAEEKAAPVELDYTVSSVDFSRFFQVASYKANLCNSLSFSFSGEFQVTRFFSLKVVPVKCFTLADAAMLSELNFTVDGLRPITRFARAGSSVRSNTERRNFFNNRIYLARGVLRL